MSLDYTLVKKGEEETLNSDIIDIRVETCGKSYEQSGLICLSIDGAHYEVERLRKHGGCRYFARGHFATNCKEDNTLGVAVIERVFTPVAWIQKNKKKFWIYKTVSGVQTCTSTGGTLKRFCFQLCQALQCIHKSGQFHGNIPNGVMFGKDDNVRLCKFMLREEGKTSFSEARIAREQKNDIVKMIQVVKDIIENHGPITEQHLPKHGRKIPSDIQFFIETCELAIKKVPSTLIQFRDLSRWVYNSSFFWKPQIILSFYQFLNTILDVNRLNFKQVSFLSAYADWAKALFTTGEDDFDTCFNFHGSNILYNEKFGILRFIDNFRKHYRHGTTEFEKVEFVTRCFPDFLENIYNEATRIRDVDLIIGGEITTLNAVIWEKNFIFNMDDCNCCKG